MSKLRESARGQACTLNVVGVCNHNAETTVLAHLPSEYKGMGNKSPDWCACFACSSCHDVIDNRKMTLNSMFDYLDSTEKEWYMRRAMVRTWKVWIDEGLVEVA